MNRFILFVVLLTTIVACKPAQYPPPPRPTPVVTDTQYCDAAEENLNKLGCPEGKPTKRGTRFGKLCRELHENGIFVNPQCLATIITCSAVDVCTNTVVEGR